MGLQRAGRTLIGPLQKAIKGRTPYAACVPTPANKALAHALRRARFLDWEVTGGPQPPPPSVLAEFAPSELARMNVSSHAHLPKQKLWVGLRFHEQQQHRSDEEEEEEGGGGDARLGGLVPRLGGPRARLPVLGAIRGWSAKDAGSLWLPAAQLAEIVQGGKPFGDKDYMMGLEPGQGIFLQTEKGVFEIREALKKNLGGHLICRAWPSLTTSGGKGEQ